jgi:hypothetical protein
VGVAEVPALTPAGDVSGTGSLPAGEWRLPGRVAPGNSPGCITGENIVLAPTSTLVIEIGGRAACSQFDRFIVQNRLALNGATLELRLLNGFVPQLGDNFDVLDWGVLEGVFGAVNVTAAQLPATLAWDSAALLQNGTLAVAAAGQTAVAARAVPLPAWSLLLGGVVIAAIGARARRAGARARSGVPPGS